MHSELIKIGLSYDDNPQKVKAILKKMAVETEGVQENPAPLPLTLSYDDFSITYGLKFFIDDYDNVIVIRDAAMTKIYDAAHARSIRIPFPVREIRMKDKQMLSTSPVPSDESWSSFKGRVMRLLSFQRNRSLATS